MDISHFRQLCSELSLVISRSLQGCSRTRVIDITTTEVNNYLIHDYANNEDTAYTCTKIRGSSIQHSGCVGELYEVYLLRVPPSNTQISLSSTNPDIL